MDDMISRKASIEALNDNAELLRRALDNTDIIGAERAKYEWGLGLIESCISDMEELPSAQPERKTGHWIKTARWGRVYYCDQCRNYLDFDGVNAGRGSTNFCPNCGADMREEQDG